MFVANMNGRILIASILTLALASCIGDDIVDDVVEPSIRITNPLVEMEIGTEYQFEVQYINAAGEVENRDYGWTTSDPEIMTVDWTGLATAVEYGTVTIGVHTPTSPLVETFIEIEVTDQTVEQPMRTGTLNSTSSYTLQGDFVLSEEGSGLRLTFDSNYLASSSLPGLEVYLTNNPSTTAGAYELGPVSVFSGSHFYDIPEDVTLFEYSHVLYFCAPFNVKVGDGAFVD